MEGVKAATTWTREEGSVSNLVLHNKKRSVKFKVNIIIMENFLNREKILFDFWDMKHL